MSKMGLKFQLTGVSVTKLFSLTNDGTATSDVKFHCSEHLCCANLSL